MRLALLILLMVMSQASSGDSYTRVAESGSVLKRTLHPFISEKTDANFKSVSYCPDNLCLAFDAPESVEWGRVYDFSILFLLYKSGFPEFVESEYQMPSKMNPRKEFLSIQDSIFGRYPVCKEDNQASRANCVLNAIVELYGVRAFFVREDEGVEIRLEQKLTVGS